MTKKDTNHYIATDPSGRKYDVKDMNDFCKRHDLYPSNMRKVAKGQLKTCQSWSCSYASKGKLSKRKTTEKNGANENTMSATKETKEITQSFSERAKKIRTPSIKRKVASPYISEDRKKRLKRRTKRPI